MLNIGGHNWILVGLVQQASGHHAGMAELPHAAADEEPVAVFDMRTGAKTRVLHFG